jgi:hypothetical protein
VIRASGDAVNDDGKCDECGPSGETPAERWTRMRGWAEMQILREVEAHEGGVPIHMRLRDRKGGDPSEWPEDLRVREFTR